MNEQIEDAVVVNETPHTEKPKTETHDIIARAPKFRDDLVELLSKIPLTMGNDDSERLYNAYLALKQVPVIQINVPVS
jgi:hypothetical protein